MLTDEMKKTIVAMYKKEIPLKVIGFELGVAIPTVASYIRRNHPALQRWSTERRMKRIAHEEKKISSDLNVTQSTASSIHTILLEKFEIKKRNCLSKKKEFTIEFKDIKVEKTCPYLGTKLDFYAVSRTEDSVTFDRIDNTKGYVKGNVVLCSWRANRIKNDGTAEEHERIAAFMRSA